MLFGFLALKISKVCKPYDYEVSCRLQTALFNPNTLLKVKQTDNLDISDTKLHFLSLFSCIVLVFMGYQILEN